MKCPHCIESFHATDYHWELDDKVAKDADGLKYVGVERCPACNRFIVSVGKAGTKTKQQEWLIVYPKGVSRRQLSPLVPSEFAEDYRESCLVVSSSPKASAALSRRCLQSVLRDAAHTKKKDLAEQIEEVLPTLPTYFRKLIDHVRVVGNFAAHPIKSKSTGEIIEVEPGEAEHLLDVLEMAFDFFFVQPAEAQQKTDALNSKLQAAGKPPLK